MVRRQRDAVCEANAAAVRDLLLRARFDEPDAIRRGGRIGDVNIAVVRHDNVVAANALGDDAAFSIGVVRDHFRLAARDGVEPSIWAERLSVSLFGICDKLRHPAIQSELVRFAVGNVVEEKLAFRVGGRAFGEPVALAHELPALIG